MTRGILLCSDLDRTLLPNGPQPESPGSREYFSAVAERPEVTLVYVTGRHRELVEQAIENYCLPRPDYVIGDVGSSLFAITPHDWQLQQDWQEEIAPDWAGMQHDEIHTLLAGIRVLRLQETAKQNTWKLSYYVPLYADNVALLDEIRERLEHHAVNASLIWSVDEPAAVGLLDILPASANKLHAIEFLRARNGFSYADTLFAGDSGNDLSVLASAIPAVLVANASQEVREAALREAQAQGHADALYIARGGYLGMNGNYSAGLLEGLAHFMPHTTTWVAGKEAEQQP
jgi:HAD superfamily hydrolase (TIGR01484 family)